MELSKIIIGQGLLILVIASFLIFLSQGIAVYQPSSIPSDYNSSFVRLQNGINNLTDYMNRTQADIKAEAPTSGNLIDFIGFYFSAGYKGLGIAVQSVGITYDLVDEGTNAIAGGTQYGSLLKAVGMILILVVILIAIILSIIFKWQT